MTEKIVRSLNLKVATRDMRHNDPQVQLCAVMSRWLPVSDAVLGEFICKEDLSKSVLFKWRVLCTFWKRNVTFCLLPLWYGLVWSEGGWFSPQGEESRRTICRVNFLCWLLFRYAFHPHVTVVACKRPWAFCLKCILGRLWLNLRIPLTLQN